MACGGKHWCLGGRHLCSCGFEPRRHQFDGRPISVTEFEGVEVLVSRNKGVNSVNVHTYSLSLRTRTSNWAQAKYVPIYLLDF